MTATGDGCTRRALSYATSSTMAPAPRRGRGHRTGVAVGTVAVVFALAAVAAVLVAACSVAIVLAVDVIRWSIEQL